jgi:hypothetical protein
VCVVAPGNWDVGHDLPEVRGTYYVDEPRGSPS